MRRDHRFDDVPHELMDRLEMRVSPIRRRLLDHPIYAFINSEERLRRFMSHHAFAVWDFMSLAKRLQQDLTCTRVPWTPPADPEVARLINEIILEEETDRSGSRHEHCSHYELYLRAMEDVGADSSAVRQLVGDLQDGLDFEHALERAPIAETTRHFTRTTLSIASGPVHEVASAFLFGREDVIPSMFQRVLWTLDRQDPLTLRARRRFLRLRDKMPQEWEHRVPDAVDRWLDSLADDTRDPRWHFRFYLERHIELDGDAHGPAARRLLGFVCGRDEQRWHEATESAARSLEARIAFWDGVKADIEGKPRTRVVVGARQAVEA